MTGIFIESNENLGLLYNRYKDIPEITDKFIDQIQNSDDVSEKLDEYKRTIRGIMKSPEPINPRTTKKEKQKVKAVRDKVERLVTKLRKAKDHCESNNSADKSPTSIESAVKWVQKVIVDTLNLCDQDLNLLSLVDTVYYRKIYENDYTHMMSDHDEYNDIMECAIDDVLPADLFSPLYDQFFEDGDTTGEDQEDEHVKKADINEITSDISDNSKEEFYPIFPMSVSYNFGPMYTFMAPIIHGVTNGDEYTHAFMSFDPEFKTILTFGGKGLEYMTAEDYEAFKYSKSVYIGVVWLTKDEMMDVKKVIKEYNENPKDVRFSLVNFFTMMLGKIKRKDKSHCCSAFLGYLLNVANKKNLTKDYSQTRPEDITILPRSFYVGTFKDLEDLKQKRPEFKKRIKQLYDDNIDDIREYNNSIPRVMLTDNIKRKKSLKNFYKNIVKG